MPSKSLKLPTLAALEALPLRKRTLLFRRWALAQSARRTYVSDSITDCALCQFAHALGALGEVLADNQHLCVNGSFTQVIPNDDEMLIYSRDESGILNGSSTFGALAKRLTKHLNAR